MPRIGTSGYARDVARAAFDGARFTVPARPALRPEVVVAEADSGGLVFDGGPQPFAVPGASAVAAFRRLLAHLDGTCTVAQLAEASNLSAANIETLLGLLVVRGLVQDGPADASASDPTAILFSRGSARTGARPDAAAVAASLRLTSVAVVGQDALVNDLAEAVYEGLRAGSLLRSVVRSRAADVPKTTDLAVVLAPTSEVVRKLVEDKGIAVIGATVRNSTLWYGPWLDRSSAICASCYVDALAGPITSSSTVINAAALLLVTTVLQTLGRFGRAQAGNRVVCTDLAAWKSSTYDIVCPRPDGDDLTLVRRFEAAVCVPPRDWLDPAIHRVHYEQANIRAQVAFQRVPGENVVPPPVLGELLRRSVGVRTATAPGASPDRSAASAGNLGSVVAYCVLRDGDDGDGDGDGDGRVFQYDPEAAALVRIEAAALVPSVLPPAADAVVMLTGDLSKLFPKYGLKAYRLAWLDAGYALGQLHITAADLGIPDRALDTWDDAAWQLLLGLESRHEVLCGGIVIDNVLMAEHEASA